jgi:hypothetical protein
MLGPSSPLFVIAEKVLEVAILVSPAHLLKPHSHAVLGKVAIVVLFQM